MALLCSGWILCSNLTIIFNKWIIDTAGFRESRPVCNETECLG